MMFHNVLNVITIIKKVNPHPGQKRAGELEHLTKDKGKSSRLSHARYVSCLSNVW